MVNCNTRNKNIINFEKLKPVRNGTERAHILVHEALISISLS
jgi:hypothetical protein